MKRLKVFSYNIHKGFGWGIRKYTLKEMRDEIRRLQPDLIFLQEVHGRHKAHKKRIVDWPDGSQFEYLAEEIWPHFTYGKNAIYTQGHHGNAILSKFPILEWQNIDISENRFEKRGLLHTIVQTAKNDEPLHAFCVHLGLLEADRQKQLKKMVKRIRASVPEDAPVIIAGDFNDWLKNASRPLIKQLGFREAYHSTHGRYAKTFPSFLPVMQLDRIYFKNLKTKRAVCLTDSPWSYLSDHLPLEIEFTK